MNDACVVTVGFGVVAISGRKRPITSLAKLAHGPATSVGALVISIGSPNGLLLEPPTGSESVAPLARSRLNPYGSEGVDFDSPFTSLSLAGTNISSMSLIIRPELCERASSSKNNTINTD